MKSWTDTVNENVKVEVPDTTSPNGKKEAVGDPAFKTLGNDFNGTSDEGHKDGHRDAKNREKPGAS